MYVAALSWFRATGKFQYARICNIDRPLLRTQNPGNLQQSASAAERRADVVAFVSDQLENNPFPSY